MGPLMWMQGLTDHGLYSYGDRLFTHEFFITAEGGTHWSVPIF
jgi:hypothetical protein